MRKTPLLILGVLIAVVLLGSAVTAHAQGGTIDPVPVQPPSCDEVDPYDHNNDGRVDGQDYTMWVLAVHESGVCPLDEPLGSACPAWVDVNGDGFVSIADLQAMDTFRFTCVRSPVFTRPGLR